MSSKFQKRRIGGHFGAALGASTKRQRGAGWRDEVDAPEGAAAAQDDGSGSDAVVDPGTPLPSESDHESGSSNADDVGGGDGAAAHLGAAAAAGGAGVPVEQDLIGVLSGEAPLVAVAPRLPVAVTFQLVIGDATCGVMQVLLTRGLDTATERRLTACVPPAGGQIDAVSLGALCVFAGHGPLPAALRLAGDGEEDVVEAGFVLDGVDCATATAALSTAAPRQGSAGFLMAPRGEAPGLTLTLGPVKRSLDATHEVLGPVVVGRSVLRRLEALAPLSGGPQPRQQAALRVVGSPEKVGGTAAGLGPDGAPRIGGDDSGDHPFLLLEPVEADRRDSRPFGWEDDRDVGMAERDAEEQGASVKASVPPPQRRVLAAEALDVAGLELDGRDVEIQELKHSSFSRERQQGVDAIEASIHVMRESLDALQDLSEALSGQRSWLQERGNHLLRMLNKLK